MLIRPLCVLFLPDCSSARSKSARENPPSPKHRDPADRKLRRESPLHIRCEPPKKFSMARFRVEGFGGGEGISPRADGGDPSKGVWFIMDPSYSPSQVQEDRIPSFRGVRENVARLPDYSDFHDGLVGWPGDCGRKEPAGKANRSHPLPSGGQRRESSFHRLATGGYGRAKTKQPYAWFKYGIATQSQDHLPNGLALFVRFFACNLWA